MIITIVVALAENNVIGRENGLPWRMPSDLKRFKALTIGKPVVMGRKCYESIGRPLPGRPNIVITRNPQFSAEGILVAHSLEAGLQLAEEQAKTTEADEIAVIGGGEIYRQALDRVDVLHVTYVDAAIEGDTFFPDIHDNIWKADYQEDIPKGGKDEYASRFVTWRRIRSG